MPQADARITPSSNHFNPTEGAVKIQTGCETVPRCVQAGVELLDCSEPGWRGKVNPNTLDMMTKQGLLEQIYGSLEAGMKKLGISRSELERYGFFPRELRGGCKLTTVWKLVIKERPAPIVAKITEGTLEPDDAFPPA
ncbi:hypothetical protein C4587_02450 [Candidatus Parcubacteria bacterium]|nr:MAG: hypothetical protein C4587_02450 [Candidatus Parcubacteria bacterium]